MSDNYQELENLLKIKFNNPSLLEQAFIHRSYLNETQSQHSASNERLEFLGDSILSFTVSEFLYQKFPDSPEGDLTNYRSSLVCTKTLSGIAKKLNLGFYLKMSKGEKKSGGENNPSLLANTVESLIGAIYLDKGLNSVRNFINQFLVPVLSEIIKNKSFKDYKSLFQEKVQEKTRISPVYKVIDSWGPDHAKNFKIGVYVGKTLVAEGTGKSKQEAEQLAAKTAIEKKKKMR